MSGPTRRGRPLTGTLRRTATGWAVEVPAAPGSRSRIRRTFPTRPHAQAWRVAAVAALRAGDPPPDPGTVPDPTADVPPEPANAAPGRRHPARGPVADLTAPTGPAGVPGVAGTRPPGTPGAAGTPADTHRDRGFAQVAAAWHTEYFGHLRRGDAGRAAAVASIIQVRLLPRLTRLGVAGGGDLTRDRYLALLADLAGNTSVPADDPTCLDDQHDATSGDDQQPRWLTLAEAVELTGASRSTLKRRLADGTLPSSRLDPTGRRLISRADLHHAGLLASAPLRRGPRPTGYTQAVLADTRRVLDAILAYGATPGVDAWTLTFDPASIPNPRSSRTRPRPRRQVTLDDTVALAAHLHAVHQVALWLMRLLGLRISEAFGLQVDDLVDLGHRGLLRVQRQGGGPFLALDPDTGAFVTVDRVNHLKNTRSERALIVPEPLMDLLRLTITVFHTGADGAIDPTARLIPGLRQHGRGGTAAFRSALRTAAQATDLTLGPDPERALLPRPHDLRKGAVTDWAWTDGLADLARRRFAGHAPGSDVHAGVYILDHPELRPLVAVADAIETQIAAAAPHGLAIPTTTRCTTGTQPALAPRRDHIDTALAEAGWLLPPGGNDPDLLTSDQIATLLAITPGTARRWLRDGTLPATTLTRHARGQRRTAHLDDVLTLADTLATSTPLTDLAAELHVPPPRLHAWADIAGLPLRRVGRQHLVPDDAARRLRTMARTQQALTERSITLEDAATQLHLHPTTVQRLIDTGRLALDSARDPEGRRYVTRASVAALTRPPRR